RSQISDGIVSIVSVAFGMTPAICKPIACIVFVAQELDTCLIDFIGYSIELIVTPLGRVGFAVNQICEVSRAVVTILNQLIVGVGFKRFASGRVVGPKVGEVELTGVR